MVGFFSSPYALAQDNVDLQGQLLKRIVNLEKANLELVNRIEQLERLLPQDIEVTETLEGAQVGGNPEKDYETGIGAIRKGDFEDAEVIFKKFINQFPDHTLTPNAFYWLGESFFARNVYGAAAKNFLDSYAKFPESGKAPDSLLKLALSLAASNEKAGACTAFDKLINEYPEAKKTIIDLAISAKQKNGCN